MTKPKVYVSRIIADEGLKDLREVCDLHIWRAPELMPRDTQFQLFSDCTGLLTTTDIRIDRELLEACPQLNVVSNHAVGFDNIDVPTCSEIGVPAGNTPGVLSDTTRIKMAQMAAGNIVRALNGQPMLSCINPESVGKGRSASLYR